MAIGWVWLVFVLGAALLALAAFPHLRQQWVARIAARQHAVAQQGSSWVRRVRSFGDVLTEHTMQHARACYQLLAARWPWLLFTLALLLVPAALTWWWGLTGGQTLDAFDDRVTPGNQHVAHLLLGEQLVPPPPLPPDVFVTAEVEQLRPMLSSADRHWDQMDAEFVQRVLLVFKIMREEHGYDMALLEGYRSPERQDMLLAKGSHVTQAKAWQSWHQYGLAADCAFVRGGKLVISEKDPWAQKGYELYGQVAEQAGLTWGGRWQMLDLGHVEWRKPGTKALVR